MSSTLIIGDIHSNFRGEYDRIWKVLATNRIDRVIFLGDYVDTRDQDENDPEDIDNLLKDLMELIEFKKDGLCKNMSFLCGNHDWAYLTNTMHTGQTIEYIQPKIKELLIKLDLKAVQTFSHDTSSPFGMKSYVCSHAGLCKKWVDNFFPSKRYFIDKINMAFETTLENFDESLPNPFSLVGPHRRGYDPYSGPLWCDINELYTDLPHNLNQVIGHTYVSRPTDILKNTGITHEFEGKLTIWAIDTTKTGKCGLVLFKDGYRDPIIIE